MINSIGIREVWNDNLVDEIGLISSVVDHFPYVAVYPVVPDPLVLRRPFAEIWDFSSLVAIVNKTKLIQLGLTFFDANGNLPTCNGTSNCVWQFNFREFNPDTDIRNATTIDHLRSLGIDFDRNMIHGVDSLRFEELLTSFNLVRRGDMHWIGYYGAMDFGYLLKILTGGNLPAAQADFDHLIRTFFPVMYDLKHVTKNTDVRSEGLETMADSLGIDRVSYLAASDSFLVSRIFMELKNTDALGPIDVFAGVIEFGIDDEDDDD